MVRKYDNKYSQDPANLAHQGLDELLAGFTEVLADCATLLRPGGLAVVTARPWRQHGELVDLPTAVIAAGEQAGLTPVALVCRPARRAPRRSANRSAVVFPAR